MEEDQDRMPSYYCRYMRCHCNKLWGFDSKIILINIPSRGNSLPRENPPTQALLRVAQSSRDSYKAADRPRPPLFPLPAAPMQRNSVYPPDGSRPTNSLKLSFQEAKDKRAAAKGLVRFARMIGEIYDGRRQEEQGGGGFGRQRLYRDRVRAGA